MPLVLRTNKDAPAAALANLPRMPGNGVGGVLLTVAAERLEELQKDGKPLEGKDLEKAARAFAEERGYDVGQISDAKAAKLAELAGGHPDRPPAAQVAEERGAALEQARNRSAEVAPEEVTEQVTEPAGDENGAGGNQS